MRAGLMASPTRERHPCLALDGACADALGRIVPGVKRQVEGAPVHGQKRSAAEHLVRDEGVVGAEMDFASRLVEGTDFEHDEIERPAVGAN